MVCTLARDRLSVTGVKPSSEFIGDMAWGGHVAGRLPLEHTDIEIHEIESSRRIIATSFRVIRRCENGRHYPAGACHDRLSWRVRTSCDGSDQGRSDERFPVCGRGGAERHARPAPVFGRLQ